MSVPDTTAERHSQRELFADDDREQTEAFAGTTARPNLLADVREGRRRRDAGMAAVASVADAWGNGTAYAGVAYLASTRTEDEPFDSGFLHGYHGPLRLPAPFRPRLYGNVLSNCRKRGVIRAAGATRSARPTSHGALVNTWVSTEWARSATPEEWLRTLPEIRALVEYVGRGPQSPAELLRAIGALATVADLGAA